VASCTPKPHEWSEFIPSSNHAPICRFANGPLSTKADEDADADDEGKNPTQHGPANLFTERHSIDLARFGSIFIAAQGQIEFV
jgi:hypothetical protein